MTKFEWQDEGKGFLKIREASLEYACFGPPPEDTPTIVLLHEGLGCVELWKSFPKDLAERTGMGVFVYSRAGYGKSSPVELPRPLDYMTREAIDVLPHVLNAIGIRNAVLLGHSDGATIAAIYAGSVQDHRIRGLVLMAPHFFAEPISIEAISKAREAYETADLREKLAKYHERPDVAFKGWCEAWLDPEFQEWDVSEVIDFFRVPVLAIQGTDDQYGTLAQIEAIEAHIYSPLDTLILENCGHAPHMEKPEETLSAISDFVQRLERIGNEPVNL